MCCRTRIVHFSVSYSRVEDAFLLGFHNSRCIVWTSVYLHAFSRLTRVVDVAHTEMEIRKYYFWVIEQASDGKEHEIERKEAMTWERES